MWFLLWPVAAAVGACAVCAGHAVLTNQLLQRQLRVFRVAMRVFLDYKLTQYYLTYVCGALLRLPVDDASPRSLATWQRAHTRCAGSVYAAMVRLEGLWVKVGQYLSTRADVMPAPYLDLLRQLQDTLPPRDMKEVLGTIEEELGSPPSQAFSSFDHQPLATASIAQVHRAVTASGQQVVVKVQHAGVKEKIQQDFRNLTTIVDWLAWAEPDYDFKPVVGEWAKEVLKELDFRLEAANLERVARNFQQQEVEQAGMSAAAGEKNSALAVEASVPAVVRATERVLVMDFVDGARLSDLAALDSLGVDRQALLNRIARAYAHQIYVGGFFNADPHPGNFLVSREAPHLPVLLDFGLTKAVDRPMRVALAKMLLAAAEGDVAMLLSAFSEMGLKMRVDLPEDAMAVTAFFFRRAAPAPEAKVEVARMREQFKSRAKQLEEQAKAGGDDAAVRRNPVDAFPGELMFFSRVLALLRGISATLDVHLSYIDIMRPFAEAVLCADNLIGPQRLLSPSPEWVRGVCAPPSLHRKLCALLADLLQHGRLVGVQVCAYMGGEVVVDVAAGFLGRYDPRPVQHDSLFSVFSATKGVTSGIMHCLADQRRLQLEGRVADIWPGFEGEGKHQVTVSDVLTHRAGLPNAMSTRLMVDPMLMCRWREMLSHLAAEVPESPPGTVEEYHYLSFGWLAGGIIEAASGQSFQEVLDAMLARPLGVRGEFYVGIPAGVESRLATLSLERSDVPDSAQASAISRRLAEAARREAAHREDVQRGGQEAGTPREQGVEGGGDGAEEEWELVEGRGEEERVRGKSSKKDAVGGSTVERDPSAAAHAHAASSSLQSPPPSGNPATTTDSSSSGGGAKASIPSSEEMAARAAALPLLFNSLFLRRAVIPSANGHFSARALARYYATLAASGLIPPVPSSSDPPLGTHAAEPAAVVGGDKEGGAGGAERGLSFTRRGQRSRGQWLAGMAGWVGQAVGRAKQAVGGVVGGLGRRSDRSKKDDDDGAHAGADVVADSCDPFLPQPQHAKVTGSLLPLVSGTVDPHGDPPSTGLPGRRLFASPDIVDACLGVGRYSHLTLPSSSFGLGFVRYRPSGSASTHSHASQSADGTAGHTQAAEAAVAEGGRETSQDDTPAASQPPSTSSAFFPHDTSHMAASQSQADASSSSRAVTRPDSSPVSPERWAFGHAGLGGSTAFCDPEHNFALAVTVNHLSARHEATSAIVRLVCSELGVPVPMQYDGQGHAHSSTQGQASGSSNSKSSSAGDKMQDTPDSMNA
ncbi:hypothetical protein CLOM_g8969 [Closterium sp. NIES-68]|nr:hypothetical protein CLOM_g8969 [Closterium sp. NIES-68]GJP84816.1 hypothetical protein CLOP_g14867 [Closterium sp. NIES-67]